MKTKLIVIGMASPNESVGYQGGEMSEKVKCRNPGCENGSLYGDAHGIKYFRDYCPVCNGTGYIPAPTGEGLLTDEAIQEMERELYNKYAGKGLTASEVKEIHSSEFFQEICKAQAALTAGQKDREWQKEVNQLVKEVESYADELVKAKRVAGQMIETIKIFNSTEIDDMEERFPEWKVGMHLVDVLESRYGGKQSGSTIEKGGKG